MTDLSGVDGANEAVQADQNQAQLDQEVVDALHSMEAEIAELHTEVAALQPAAPTGGGLGLYQLGGSLSGCSHLSDGTYDVVIGDWDEADLLARVSGDGYVYTVVAGTPGADPSAYTVLNPGNPQAYIDRVVAHKAAHGFAGAFLDNCLGSISGLLAALATVHDGLSAHGIKFAANLGNYIAGDPNSDNGVNWKHWAEQASAHLDVGMLENWMQFSGGPPIGQLRTNQNGGNYDGWHTCPGAALGSMRFMGVTYGPPAEGTSSAGAVYGRAALLTAPNVSSSAIFGYSTPGTDPYNATWTKPDPNPVIDANTGTASL